MERTTERLDDGRPELITAAEWRLLAEQAERYPAGNGMNWGYGPLVCWMPGDAAPELREAEEYG